MDNITQIKTVLEAALLTSATPLSLDDMSRLFSERIERATFRMLLDELKQDWLARSPLSMELVQVASGWRFQAVAELAPFLSRLNPERPQRYSRAAMETLAIIAYRQPVTRGDIEEIRGVAVNPNTMRQLQERDWIDIVGQRDVPGRPALYATTKTFLDDLNLKSLADLPAMKLFVEQSISDESIVPEILNPEVSTQLDLMPDGDTSNNQLA
jgi:segregation and condensation protein B